MKYLLLGIDGGQNEIFQRYEMPFVQSLIKKGRDLNLNADLTSRGWVEIYTGKSAIKTGGFYERPLANGCLEWSKDFKLSNIHENAADVKSLWQVLNETGFKVGVMNVPTTNPAPQVDGFFVSGGGGGANIAEGADESQCYPSEVKKILDDLNYIVDERVPSLLWEKGLYEPEYFIDRLILMTEKRIESFILLTKRYQVDFGFLVLRSVVVIEFLVSGEVARYLKGDKNINEELIKHVFRFYRKLDELIKQLFELLIPEQAMLVSDHGLVPRLYGVNLNNFLKKIGCQYKSDNKNSLLQLVKTFRHLIPYSVRQKLKQNKKIKSGYQSLVSFDKTKSVAFNITQMGAIYGVYINDTVRFGGPVNLDQIESIKENIIKLFNENVEVNEHGLKAVAYERGGHKFEYMMPDILIRMPAGYVPTNEIKQFFKKNNPSFQQINLKLVKDDNWTGAKSIDALAIECFTGNGLNRESTELPRGLTQVYEHVVNYFDI
ncbi:MAG: hypothetical protein HOK37_12015 [Gammaproteobacteria bacterium]|nr:hypothetical protein [Gammaproteobacteria bacterium]